MTAKSIESVEMMHRGAEEVLAKTARMNPSEELAWWQGRSKQLRQAQLRAKAHSENTRRIHESDGASTNLLP